MSTVLEPAKITGRALQIGLQDRICSTVRSDPDWVGRAEYACHRTVERDRKMHRPGVVGYANGGAADQRCQLAERCHASEVDRAWRQTRDLFTDGALATRA